MLYIGRELRRRSHSNAWQAFWTLLVFALLGALLVAQIDAVAR